MPPPRSRPVDRASLQAARGDGAGLDQLAWIRTALDAMDRGVSLPEPFTEPAAVFPLVRGSATSARAVITRAGQPQPSCRIHRPSFAVPAIFSAMHPDPLRALVDTFSHAAATFGEQRDSLVSGLRQRFVDSG